MLYTIKPGDTLSKVATRHQVPLNMLLAVNPKIKNANLIYVGQVISIPNLEENPEPVTTIEITPDDAWINRAKTAINQAIGYKLGQGGMKPELTLPSNTGLCDCSGFVCWIFKIKRLSDVPFYRRYAGWINTDSMVGDILSSAGIFERLDVPESGCIVVYRKQKKGSYGHVGIVSETKNGAITKVIHCSMGNHTRFGGKSIQETGPGVFLNKVVYYGKFSG